MTFLRIVAIIILIFWLIGMIKVGISVSFLDGRFSLALIILNRRITLGGKKKKEGEEEEKEEKKEEKEKPPDDPEQEEKEKKEKKPLDLSLTLGDIGEILTKVIEDVAKIFKGLNFDRFWLYISVATPDPYTTAYVFGNINLILNILAPICAQRFTCRDLDVWTKANFDESLPRISFSFDLTIRIHTFTRRIDVLFDILKVLIDAKRRGVVLKITDREEYEYELELKKQRSQWLSSIRKKSKPDNGEAQIEQDSERKIS